MKYEYLCGHESYFFTMPANIIAVVRLDYCVQGLTEFSQIVECGKPVLAMRRIIKEPNSWTWEDKKAGRLPEVGCDIQYIDSQKLVSVIAINSNEVVLLAKSNGSKFFVLDPDSLLQYYNPIETPAEKAQREEDEFIDSLKSVEIHDGTVSSFFNQGARAAYRKMKGGE